MALVNDLALVNALDLMNALALVQARDLAKLERVDDQAHISIRREPGGVMLVVGLAAEDHSVFLDLRVSADVERSVVDKCTSLT